MNNIIFRKAERKKAKLRLALCGPSGAGKTYSALLIASGLGNKIAMLDTERKSGELYANDFNYDICPLDHEFSPDNYIQIINGAEKAGYDVLIIDSLTHAWSGEGGILELVDKAAQASKSKNSYYAWRNVTPQHNSLVDAILKSSMHIIVTMRSKTDYIITDEGGKSKPIKVGMAPVQREGMDYEFTVVLDLSVENNIASASKDRTKIFKGKNFIVTKQTGIDLMEWLEDGRSQEDVIAETIKDYARKIQASGTLDSLRKIYTEAIHEAKSLQSETMEKELIALKDKKKIEIEAIEAQQFIKEMDGEDIKGAIKITGKALEEMVDATVQN